ncbi:PREDICTED: protein WVD2-like 7 [Camelina sativa]|uniref:Protein WVD2-like 7 n=1 Tax=Camelina sativa TaxID=90675 RepID=A0ABM0Z8X3_CAMSA|nr:PREDICTED: protein WVD2-like 7 [Camelina sativa]XP_010512084.1 PREDICTED: protein WVD2-like 7 [Camelina sativa]XP_010512085.1 PREDICTED: protein WVD2-like 7 [Camelina sativa]XP_010512087.1 PREDICTED: protein WVD2-like 7 [Camelina sativa]XP_010512088.1 PREDICTED: protein WVD2-like 7 [Camelina sativa]XP_010512089.1 PREDICTED: protein WVD2-like 7 [Camelina sativa]
MIDMEVGTANGEDKIMTATSSNQKLQVSVSFGKFENDSLSWEKFSSFSPNKYLEEVEKCATAGSVAQKKAYFESHYKKIAERRADIIMEQEKLLERNASFRPSVQNQNRGKTYDSDNEESLMNESSACYESNGESISEKDKLVASIATEVNETCIHDHEPLEEIMDSEECPSLADAGDDLNTLNLEKLEEIVQVDDKEKPEVVVCMKEDVKEEVKEDVSSKDTHEKNEMKKTPMKERKKQKDQNLIKKTDKNVQTNHMRSSPKPSQVTKKPGTSKVVTTRKTQPSKEKSMTKEANKAASPVLKASGFSTPRVSKPVSTISSISTSRSSVKKETVSTLPRKKHTATKSLPISLNLDQPGSDPTVIATTRKSLIMERMGDKDIVRRAFKTFQKSFDQLKPSGDGQNSSPKQVPAKATDVSRIGTTSQKNSRLAKSDGTERKGSNSHRSSSFVSKSNGTTEKQKEPSRFNARSVEKIRLQAKPKAEATNSKTRRQSLDPKAKSKQGLFPKDSLHKVL